MPARTAARHRPHSGLDPSRPCPSRCRRIRRCQKFHAPSSDGNDQVRATSPSAASTFDNFRVTASRRPPSRSRSRSVRRNRARRPAHRSARFAHRESGWAQAGLCSPSIALRPALPCGKPARRPRRSRSTTRAARGSAGRRRDPAVSRAILVYMSCASTSGSNSSDAYRRAPRRDRQAALRARRR